MNIGRHAATFDSFASLGYSLSFRLFATISELYGISPSLLRLLSSRCFPLYFVEIKLPFPDKRVLSILCDSFVHIHILRFASTDFSSSANSLLSLVRLRTLSDLRFQHCTNIPSSLKNVISRCPLLKRVFLVQCSNIVSFFDLLSELICCSTVRFMDFSGTQATGIPHAASNRRPKHIPTKYLYGSCFVDALFVLFPRLNIVKKEIKLKGMRQFFCTIDS